MNARNDFPDLSTTTDRDAIYHEVDHLRNAYRILVDQCEDIKEQYRDCASELAAERRHHAHLQETCDALSTNVIRLTEEKEVWGLTSQVIYLEQQRWQEMAEDLWEELQEWHDQDECPAFNGPDHVENHCTCHRILAAKWDELTHANDWADDDIECNDPGVTLP